jgi:hypothetical protein
MRFFTALRSVQNDMNIHRLSTATSSKLSITRSQVALGNVAAKRPSLIIIFIERNNARPVRVPGRTGLARTAGVETVTGAFIPVLVPKIAALPDAVAEAGKGADDGGVVSQHILRIMAGRARYIITECRRDACVTGRFQKGDPPGRP